MAQSKTVTSEMIAAAEPLFGVEYSESERALMLGNLEGMIEAALARRAHTWPNDLPPATRFDPRLPGAAPPAPAAPLVRSPQEAGPLPESEEDIAFAPVTELSQWLRSGALSSRRLTEIYLDRIERFAPALECMVTVTADLARAQADAADALLRGHPIPPDTVLAAPVDAASPPPSP